MATGIMGTRRLLTGLVTATLVAAGSVGCGSSAPRPHSTAPAQAAPAQLAAARTGALMVVDDYERSGAAARSGAAKKADAGGIAQYFADQGTAARFQGAGGIGAPIGCGVATGKNVVDGAVVGTPVTAQNTISVPVSLYIGTKQAAQVSVTADLASGKLKDFSCGPVAAPDLPGVKALVGYYGGAVALGAESDAKAGSDGGADSGTDSGSDSGATAADDQLKQQFLTPAFAKWTWPGLRTAAATCSEDTMTYWHAAYAPSDAPTGGAPWYFWPAGSQVIMSVAVDPSANRVAWVNCPGELVPRPATPATYSDDQVQSYVGDLFNGYAYLRALQPLGADASVIKGYFASPDAYSSTAAGTGAQPLECSPTAAGSINADSVTVSGTSATVTLTSAPSAHPLSGGETALGHPKVTIDLPSMKITSVSCG